MLEVWDKCCCTLHNLQKYKIFGSALMDWEAKKTDLFQPVKKICLKSNLPGYFFAGLAISRNFASVVSV